MGKIERADASDGEVRTAQHTPGPWCVRRLETRHLITASALDHFRGNRMAVCELHQWSPGIGPTAVDQAANARLIAAAPDLLDVLRAIITHGELACVDAGGRFWSGGKKPPTKDVWQFPRHMLVEIEAVLSKSGS